MNVDRAPEVSFFFALKTLENIFKTDRKVENTAMSSVAVDWTCLNCECVNDEATTVCEGCDEPRPVSADTSASDSPYPGIKIGRVLSCDPVPGKDKLLLLSVDVGAASKPLSIVTSAPNVEAGCHVVVATIGATVDGVAIRSARVGGALSEGMLCSNPMLGWKGGGATTAALVPTTLAPGSAPPASAPRLK